MKYVVKVGDAAIDVLIDGDVVTVNGVACPGGGGCHAERHLAGLALAHA